MKKLAVATGTPVDLHLIFETLLLIHHHL